MRSKVRKVGNLLIHLFVLWIMDFDMQKICKSVENKFALFLL